MTTLYISGTLSKDKKEIVCPLQSSVILFMMKYCQSNIKLVFVSEDCSPPPSNICSYKIDSFSDFCFEFSTWQSLPHAVRNVILPSIHQLEMKLVRSGLCVILRHIIRDSHDQNPSLNLIDLLGFRQGSMKMCAEVSSWTKLCEVDIPNSVTKLMMNLKDWKSDTLTTERKHLTLPSELMTLEKHFKQKCRVHNDNKRQRAEISQLKNFFTKSLDDKIESDCVTSDEILETFNNFKCSEESHLPSLDFFSFDESQILIEQTVQLCHGVRKFKVHKNLAKKEINVETGECDNDNNSACDSEVKEDKTEKNVCRNSFDVSELKTALMDLSFMDIEYEHVYSEGIELTIADLILISYIYHLFHTIDFAIEELSSHLPSILNWTGHMTSLDKVNASGQSLGWNIERLRKICLHALKAKEDNTVSDIPDNLDRLITFEVGDLIGEDEEVELSRNIKMKHKALKPEVLQALQKFETVGIRPVVGAHPKGDAVQVDWDSLPAGVHPKQGNVPPKRTQRKCQQLENLATAVHALAKPGDTVVDFCSGGGHLGILCAYLLPECEVFLVENKEESLLKSSSRLQSLGLENVTLYQCNMDYFMGKFSVGLCLHACGSATDMVLELCTKCQASFVICPCCYGGIHDTHLLSYPRSKLFNHADITYTDFLTVGHAADQTEFDIKLEKQGRTCMNLVDTDRAEYAKEQGYIVTLCSLQPLTCSPKNNLLIGTLTNDTKSHQV